MLNKENLHHDGTNAYPALEIDRRFFIGRVDATLFILNLIGTIVYVKAASLSWVIPQECAAGINVTTGEPFVWASAVPIFAVFALVNILWGASICIKKRWRSGYVWIATALAWFIALWIDFAHHSC
jgi:hypothetical protein